MRTRRSQTLVSIGAVLAAVTGVVLPATAASARPPALVKATTWGLLSVAGVPGTDHAWAVGYSDAPSTAPVIAYYDGSSFHAEPAPHPAWGAELATVAPVPGTSQAWAGGLSCQAGECPAPYLLHLRDGRWSPVTLPPTGSDALLYSVAASSPDDVWAGGEWCNPFCEPMLFRLHHGRWTIQNLPGSGADFTIYAVVDASPDDVWAFGAGYQGAVAWRFDGSRWRRTPLPDNGPDTDVAAAAAVPGTPDVWAAGDGSGGPLVVQWNGELWRQVPVPSSPLFPSLNAVAASSPLNAWVAGDGYSENGLPSALMLRWDGVRWSQATVPDPAPVTELFGVATLSPSTALSVGFEGSPLQPFGNGLAVRYAGGSWRTVTVPAPRVPPAATPRIHVQLR